MLNIDYQIEILRAYKEGKTIEGRDKASMSWTDIDTSIWGNSDYSFDFQSNAYRIKPELTTRRMTNRELAKWCAEGKGEWAYNCPSNKQATIWFKYSTNDALDPCNSDIVIRTWDEEEWHEPLVIVRNGTIVED